MKNTNGIHNLLKVKTGLFSSKKAFTLTEVLVALTIVGVISALVLPAIITKYQDKTLKNAYDREKQSVQNAINSLVIVENKADFSDTIMYKASEPEDYNDSSKAFMSKYMRVSKFCDTASDCFASKYYIYQDNDKEVYTPEYKGTCAKLKNGSSICITPQIGAETPVSGIIDVNGDKGPNVFDKDLKTFELELQPTRAGLNSTTESVSDTNFAVSGTVSEPAIANVSCASAISSYTSYGGLRTTDFSGVWCTIDYVPGTTKNIHFACNKRTGSLSALNFPTENWIIKSDGRDSSGNLIENTELQVLIGGYNFTTEPYIYEKSGKYYEYKGNGVFELSASYN